MLIENDNPDKSLIHFDNLEKVYLWKCLQSWRSGGKVNSKQKVYLRQF